VLAPSAHSDRKIITQLIGWAKAFPKYADALIECAEEINLSVFTLISEETLAPALLKPGYKSSAQMILTSVQAWEGLYTCHARAFKSLIEEIHVLDEPVFTTAGGKVFHAMQQGFQTVPELVLKTGCTRGIVERALLTLVEVGLVNEPAPQGYAAKRQEGDGNLAEIYTLKQVFL
jgi:hypothetical protein